MMVALSWCILMPAACLLENRVYLQIGIALLLCGWCFLCRKYCLFRYLNLFASNTQCWVVCCMHWVWIMCAWVLIVCCCSLPAIESNHECAEEGEVFEYQEEGAQGQANQGKPSTCCISESYYYTLHFLLLLSLLCMIFYIAINL
jgi:hypothetical protein